MTAATSPVVVTAPSHPLHAGDRLWPETNCYVDVWVELLHWKGLDPVPVHAMALAQDWEGDQFTFFKTPHDDLRTLHGIEVQELNPWRSLEEHIETQVRMGRVVLVEAESFYLPDTSGTTYRCARGKTTIGVWDIDRPAKRISYFHGPGSFSLEGEDYEWALMTRPEQQQPPVMLPFAEIAKFERLERPVHDMLVARARAVLAKQVARMPEANPFAAFAEGFAAQQAWLLQESLERFHQWAFATVRQAGSCWYLAADVLRWHAERGLPALAEAEASAMPTPESCKTLQMQLARASHRRKPYDASATLAQLVADWDTLRAQVRAAVPTT